MNDAIIKGLECVGENDVLIHCGDVAFGGKENISKYVSNCKGDVILTLGNHDHHIVKNQYIQDYFESVRDIQYLQFKGQKIVACHYNLRVWHQHHKSASHAFGHTHSNLEGIGKCYDVGVDSAYKLFGEYRPFSFKEYINIVNKKQINTCSHHNEGTN